MSKEFRKSGKLGNCYYQGNWQKLINRTLQKYEDKKMIQFQHEMMSIQKYCIPSLLTVEFEILNKSQSETQPLTSLEAKINEILTNGEAIIDLEGSCLSNENGCGLLEEIQEEKMNISPVSLNRMSSPNGGFSSRNTISDLGYGEIQKTKLLEEFTDIFRQCLSFSKVNQRVQDLHLNIFSTVKNHFFYFLGF